MLDLYENQMVPSGMETGTEMRLLDYRNFAALMMDPSVGKISVDSWPFAVVLKRSSYSRLLFLGRTENAQSIIRH